MKRLALNIRTKIFLIVLLALALTLVPMLVAIAAYYFNQYKDNYIEQVENESRRLIEYLQAPLALGLEEDASNLLQQISLPDAHEALVCDGANRPWLISGSTGTSFGLSCRDDALGWNPDDFRFAQAVNDFSGNPMGTLVLAVSTNRFWQTFYQFGLMSLLFMGISLSLSFIAVRSLFRSVFLPLQALHERSVKVIESRDYYSEIPVYSKDEFGQLSQTFNSMLAAVRNHIAERNHALHEMNLLANYDALTGLPNRALCMDRLHQALKENADAEELTGIMFLDLDHFKDVNDSLGHHLGDKLLVTVANQLRAALPNDATLARLGGDEFFVIIPEAESREQIESCARACCHALEQAIELEGHMVYTRASVGIALFPEHGSNAEEIMRAADAAMYAAKESGRNNYKFFEINLSQAIKRRHLIANELHSALRLNQMFLTYQPIVHLHEKNQIGFEALLRWQHPELGMISPMEFIPIAESSGLILEVSEFVLRQAMQDVAAIKTMLARVPQLQPDNTRISINLSAAQFRASNLAEQIIAIATEYGTPMHHLTFEVTESLFISEKASASAALETLRSQGCTVSIDDFGTGYSSLSYLSTLPVDTLKIDRSFVDEVETNFNDRTITLAIIRLASSLGMDVVAEGVETAGQLKFLQRQQCAKVQGYFFSKPLALAELEEWLDQELTIKRAVL